MTLPYNPSLDPPAPFIIIKISPLNQATPNMILDCLVDTGAEVSLIPQRLVTELNLTPADAMIVEGFDGERRQLPLFPVDVVVETVSLPGLEVVAYPVEHAILGRDIINRFRLLLDGPAQILEFL